MLLLSQQLLDTSKAPKFNQLQLPNKWRVYICWILHTNCYMYVLVAPALGVKQFTHCYILYVMTSVGLPNESKMLMKSRTLFVLFKFNGMKHLMRETFYFQNTNILGSCLLFASFARLTICLPRLFGCLLVAFFYNWDFLFFDYLLDSIQQHFWLSHGGICVMHAQSGLFK